jgi:hypothetical protein
MKIKEKKNDKKTYQYQTKESTVTNIVYTNMTKWKGVNSPIQVPLFN